MLLTEHHSKRVYPHTHQVLPKLHSHHHVGGEDEDEEDEEEDQGWWRDVHYVQGGPISLVFG